MRLATVTALLLAAFLLATCNREQASSSAMVAGNVVYRERIALPDNARVSVYLEDVAMADAPADILAESHFVPQGGPPFPFVLSYDPARITERGHYGLRARIEVDGQLWFINTRHIPAFPADGKPVEVLVERVGSPPAG